MVSLKKFVSSWTGRSWRFLPDDHQDLPSLEMELLVGVPSHLHDSPPSSPETPAGFFPLYVGEDRRRFVVPTEFLSHPLFRMLLEKAQEEFGFEQRRGLVVPCSVAAFQEALNAVRGCYTKFCFGELVEEFL
ncbi:hypothetical protein MLD38_032486 [Melastoma candidum]|uniref:Uncharacterized protein n=1 Tax=Melastoma candidum TaxID=119954 RepID=A0ACB9M5K7_9MYRT|nr:hypothetical protein MLD38_032486 [Melastoma candidum]